MRLCKSVEAITHLLLMQIRNSSYYAGDSDTVFTAKSVFQSILKKRHGRARCERREERQRERAKRLTQSVRGSVDAETGHVQTPVQARPAPTSHVAAAVFHSSLCRESTEHQSQCLSLVSFPINQLVNSRLMVGMSKRKPTCV